MSAKYSNYRKTLKTSLSRIVVTITANQSIDLTNGSFVYNDVEVRQQFSCLKIKVISGTVRFSITRNMLAIENGEGVITLASDDIWKEDGSSIGYIDLQGNGSATLIFTNHG